MKDKKALKMLARLMVINTRLRQRIMVLECQLEEEAIYRDGVLLTDADETRLRNTGTGAEK
jgi:hypothetical protein